MATIKVSEGTYRKLNRAAGELRMRLGRPVSVDEAFDYILKENQKSKKSKLPSDFSGAWSMTDEEENEIVKGLENFWKGWSTGKKSRRT